MPVKNQDSLKSGKRLAPAKARKPKSPAAPTGVSGGKPDVGIFVSYSHLDTPAMERLRTHLAALMRDGVSVWFDGDLDAGDQLSTGIARALRQADIFVALLSPDYLASNYCWNIEYRRAMNRRARGSMRVVAAVVRPCDWKSTRAAGFKLLPRDGRPVTRWRSADEAFLNIAEGIKGVVRTVRKDMTQDRSASSKVAGTRVAVAKLPMPKKRTPGPPGTVPTSASAPRKSVAARSPKTAPPRRRASPK